MILTVVVATALLLKLQQLECVKNSRDHQQTTSMTMIENPQKTGSQMERVRKLKKLQIEKLMRQFLRHNFLRQIDFQKLSPWKV